MSDKYADHDAALQRDHDMEVGEAIDVLVEERHDELVVHDPELKSLGTPMLTVDELVARRNTVLDAMNKAMVKDVHYGKIPGVQKPALLKPGAEMLTGLFMLAPSFPETRLSVTDDPVSNHRDVRSVCVLTHIPTGFVIAEGHGSCSTREKKYAYRSGALACPQCGAPEVRKSKQQGKDEYYCWKKQGGCGATFANGTEEYASFVEQSKDAGARIENPDLPDQWNTVLKMAEKRALIAATLMATGASDVFTQDVEDSPGASGDSSTHEPVRRNPDPTPPGLAQWGPKQLADEFLKNGVDSEWLSQVVELMYGSGKAFADLDSTEKNLVGQKLKTAYARLVETLGPTGGLQIPPGPKRGEIQEAFASVLDGVILAGPPWRMHPPSYDPVEADFEPRTVTVDTPSEDEDIPFGDDALPSGE